MAFIATPESIEAAGLTRMRRIHLSEKHFWMMVMAAATLHAAVLLVISLWPQEEVVKVPVRILNIKLGGGASMIPQALDALPQLESVMVPDNPIKAVAPTPKPPVPATRSGTLSLKTLPTPPKSKPQPPKPATASTPQPQTTPKRVRIEERKRPMQNPIPANVPSPVKVFIPKVEQEIAAPVPMVSQASNLPPAAIAPQPIQRVRAGMVPPSRQATKPVGDGNLSQPGTVDGSPEAMAIRQRYEQQISKWLEKNKQYPPAARMLGQHGKPLLRIRIDRKGNLKFFKVEKTTGYRLIDDAALKMVQASNPFPAPPANYPKGDLLEFLIPVSFDLQ